MNFGRMAGDLFKSTGGKKTNATIGTIDSGFDTLGTIRAIGSELHPALGLLDDAASLSESATSLGQGVSNTILHGTNALGSIGGLIASKAPALAANLGQAGPLSIALGAGANVGQWMTDNLDQNVASSGRGGGRQSFTTRKK